MEATSRSPIACFSDSGGVSGHFLRSRQTASAGCRLRRQPAAAALAASRRPVLHIQAAERADFEKAGNPANSGLEAGIVSFLSFCGSGHWRRLNLRIKQAGCRQQPACAGCWLALSDNSD